MKAVILDFNGTMLFDTELHARAWSEIYRQLHPEDTKPLDTAVVCGPNNDAILKVMAPWLTPAQRMEWSEKKEALYRNISKSEVEPLQLVKGTEAFLRHLLRPPCSSRLEGLHNRCAPEGRWREGQCLAVRARSKVNSQMP